MLGASSGMTSVCAAVRWGGCRPARPQLFAVSQPALFTASSEGVRPRSPDSATPLPPPWVRGAGGHRMGSPSHTAAPSAPALTVSRGLRCNCVAGNPGSARSRP
eukprot:714543-Prymnesium_polylepis.4